MSIDRDDHGIAVTRNGDGSVTHRRTGRPLNEPEVAALRAQILEAYGRGDEDALVTLRGRFYMFASHCTDGLRNDLAPRRLSLVFDVPAAPETAPVLETPTPPPVAPPSRTVDAPPIVAAGAQPYEIVVSRSARDVLREAIHVAEDGREWGGWLYGRRTSSWERRIVITSAVGAGPDTRRTAGSISLDSEWARWWDSGNGETGVLIGDWHTHDRAIGSRTPSERDRAGWQGVFGALDAEGYVAHYLGLIVSQGADRTRWTGAQLHGYVVHREEHHGRWRIVAERAEVKETD